jgi:transcriptional regulator with XRE-family HTH domain
MNAPDIRRGRDLAAERARAGLLQREIAAQLGVSARRVCQIEWAPRVTATMASRYLIALCQATEARR